MDLPHLHDGFFDGIWLSPAKVAHLFVRTESDEKTTIILIAVEALTFTDIRQGNIILDAVVVGPDMLTTTNVESAWNLQPERTEEVAKCLNRARAKGLSALEMSTSYGAQGTALFSEGRIVSGHVLP